MRKSTLWLLLSFGLLLCLIASPSVVGATQDYVYQTVDPPWLTPETGMTQVVWINNAGLIAVQYQQPVDFENPNSNIHTALLSNGEWTIIDIPGAVVTGPSSLNSKGEIALNYSFDEIEWDIVIYRKGEYVPFPDIPGPVFWIAAINNQGQIAAQGLDGSTLVGTASGLVQVPYPDDAIFMWPFAINNVGMVVGEYATSDWSIYGFLYDTKRDVLTTPDVPGAEGWGILGINNQGDIVGVAWAGDQDLPFVIQNGRHTTLHVPDAVRVAPYSINDRGQIAGVYWDADWVSHGFIATPVHGVK